MFISVKNASFPQIIQGNHSRPLPQACQQPQYQYQDQNQSYLPINIGSSGATEPTRPHYTTAPNGYNSTPVRYVQPQAAPLDHEPKCSYSGLRHTLTTHDPKLNSDGEALHSFLLAQSSMRPQYSLQIHGTHTETRTRLVTNMSNGNSTTSSETHTETVTDFRFSIDISGSGYILEEHGVVQWSCPDEDAMFRGGMVREVDAVDGRRKATGQEEKETTRAEKARKAMVFPPWQPMNRAGGGGLSTDPNGNINPAASSKTLREWTEEYTASPKLLKEFVYKKVVYGWDTFRISESITSAIKQQTRYRGTIKSTFIVSPVKICIRADNKFSRLMSSTAWKILGTLILAYPPMWLYKRFGQKGGGSWKVAGAAYAVGCQEGLNANGVGWQGLPGAYRGEEFFREWEPLIVQCAVSRLRSNEPLRRQGPY